MQEAMTFLVGGLVTIGLGTPAVLLLLYVASGQDRRPAEQRPNVTTATTYNVNVYVAGGQAPRFEAPAWPALPATTGQALRLPAAGAVRCGALRIPARAGGETWPDSTNS